MDKGFDKKALQAIRSIVQEVSKQDESIWRQKAHKKYSQDKIEKLKESSKQCEIQTQMIRTFNNYTESVNNVLEITIDRQIQCCRLLSFSINSIRTEVDRKKSEIKNFDVKFSALINKYQQAFEEKKCFYEMTNPLFKEYRTLEIAEKQAIVQIQFLKSKLSIKRRIVAEQDEIKRKLFHIPTINFVKAVIRLKEFNTMKMNLKNSEEKYEKIKREVFELQEALKIKNEQTRAKETFLNMPKIPLAMNTFFDKKADLSVLPIASTNSNRFAMVKGIKSNVHNKIDSILNRQSRPSTPSIIEVKGVKKLNLRPFKSILEISKNLSQSNSQTVNFKNSCGNSSQCEQKNKNINNQMKQVVNIKPKVQNKINMIENLKIKSATENLKNLKLITPQIKRMNEKLDQGIQHSNYPSCLSQDNDENSVSNILKLNSQNNVSIQEEDKRQGTKRKNNADDDMSSKKEKIVNFAVPLEQVNFQNISMTRAYNEDIDLSLNTSSAILNANKLDMSDDQSFGGESLDLEKPNFDFSIDNIVKLNGNKKTANAPAARILEKPEAKSNFGFSFAAAAADSLWDLFS